MNDSKVILGIDWGTTNRRAYVLDAQGKLLRQHADGNGILAVGAGNFEKSLQNLLEELGLGPADVIMSGMVGSRNGWRQVPYLTNIHPLSRLYEALLEIDSPLPDVRCRIVPGYQFADAFGTPDVMRGEETQIFGAMASGIADGWFVLPGTHSKWVRLEQGQVSEITTFMTGELYALLTQHGTLANLMQMRPDIPEAFEAGLSAAQHCGFTHAAFGCRARVVTEMMPAEHAASYLSGILIGAELADIRRKESELPHGQIQIIGSPSLAGRYVDALAFFDMQSHVWPPDEVYIAALRVLAAMVS